MLVIGEAEALRVAVDNLVSNAVKFSFVDGRIDIRVHGKDDLAVMRVGDAGPGLAAGEEERIFAPGVRGSAARASGAEGSGQGLAIARDIAQEHGGRLTVEARGGQRGASFVLELPRVRLPSEAMTEADALA